MSAEASSRIVAHVGVGKTYGIVVGIIQGFVEALILLIHYHENIFQPQDIFQSHVFLFSINGWDKLNDPLVYARLEYKLVAARSRHSKLIHHFNDVENEFYDMINDPQEKVNLLEKASIDDLPESEEHMVSLLNWLNAQREVSQTLPQTDGNKKIELSQGMKEQLKALGYIQ